MLPTRNAFIKICLWVFYLFIHLKLDDILIEKHVSKTCLWVFGSFYCGFFFIVKTGWFLRLDVLWYTNVRLDVRPFHMSRSNLRTPWPIHFKFHRVIGIDGLTVCILYGEISNFHSRVMGLYSSNCRQFFVCRAVNWEPLGQFTSNFV